MVIPVGDRALSCIVALELLAGAPEGCTDGLMFANGLATTHAERMVAGGKSVEVAPIKITEVGRRALAR